MKSGSGKEIVRILERHGWTLRRIRSSHHILSRPGAAKPISVPVHGNQSLPWGTQRAIMRDAGLTEDDL